MMAKTGWAAVIAAVWIGAAEAASLSVTDVKIAQRYPWNGLVDITYTVNCDDSNKDVWVYPVGYDADKDVSVALMPQYLSGAGASNAVHSGTHQMTWDMAKQMGKDYNRAAFSVKLHAYCDAAPYMVIDLSAGSEAEKYDVSYLSEIPVGGWTDEYKTTKMVFRLIPPGTFMMGSPADEVGRVNRSDSVPYGWGYEDQVSVTLTKPYYCAILPLTQQQYCSIVGGAPEAPTHRQIAISYDMARGKILGSQWPRYQQVDADSIVGKLRLRTGMTIDLPTCAQWEYMARAGSADAYAANPNAWGIMAIGEMNEWCLDYFSYAFSGGVDPVGPAEAATSAYDSILGKQVGCRTWRGGWFNIYNDKYKLRDGRIAAHLSYCIAYNGNSCFTIPSYTGYASEDGNYYLPRIGIRIVVLPVCK